MTLFPELRPRNGHTLKVLVICRVSDPKPGKQDERSLSDQESEHREWLARNCQFPVEVTVIAGTGSGEYLDRKESLDAVDAVESGEYDLVLCEDLGRIFAEEWVTRIAMASLPGMSVVITTISASETILPISICLKELRHF